MIKFYIFQRYLLKQYLVSYLAALLLFLGMFVIVKFMEQLHHFIKDSNPLTPEEHLMYFVYEFPNMMVYFIPIATLFSIVYILGRANSNHELIGFYNSGKSIFTAITPIIIFTFIQGIFFLVAEKEFIFDNHHKHINLHRKLINSSLPAQNDRYNLTTFGRSNKLYFIKLFRPSTDTMYNMHVLYIDNDSKNFKKIISTSMARYDKTNDTWLSSNTIIRRWSTDGKLSTIKKKTYRIDLQENPFHFKQKTHNVEHLASREILALAKKYEIIGGNPEYYLTHFFFNTSKPFWSLIIIFFGIPLSNFSRKSSIVTSLFMVVVISFLFFIISYVGNSLGKEGFLPPFVAGWFGVIVFAIITYFVTKHRQI